MVTTRNEWCLCDGNVNNYKALLIATSGSFGNPVPVHVISHVNIFDVYRGHVISRAINENTWWKCTYWQIWEEASSRIAMWKEINRCLVLAVYLPGILLDPVGESNYVPNQTGVSFCRIQFRHIRKDNVVEVSNLKSLFIFVFVHFNNCLWGSCVAV
jgi:hypothetical protein